METALQELIFQGLLLLIGVVFTTMKLYLDETVIADGKLRTLLTEAVQYAEQEARAIAKVQSRVVAGSEKMDLARDYINKMSPATIKQFGNELNTMLTMKVGEVINANKLEVITGEVINTDKQIVS